MVPQHILDLEERLNTLLPQSRYEEVDKHELWQSAVNWSEAVWQQAHTAGPVTFSPAQIAAAQRLINDPVFVCGVHRSGTTLVRDLLDDHPALSVFPAEGTFIMHLEPKLKTTNKSNHAHIMTTEWLRRLACSINQPPYWLLGRSTIQASPYVSFAQATIAWWHVLQNDLHLRNSFLPHLAVMLTYTTATGRLGNALYWVDKTPTNEQFLSRLWKEFPRARVIHVLRDPADVIVSRKNMDPFPNFRSFVYDLRQSYKAALKYGSQPNYLLVHYEALYHQPKDIASQIAAFLQIENTTSLLVPTVAGKPAVNNSSFKNELTPGQIRKAPAPSEKKLSGKELNALSAVLRKEAALLGYLLPPVSQLRAIYINSRFKMHLPI